MSDLITADLVLLDENLGETRFDVIAKLAQTVVNAGRATDFEQLYAAAEARESKTDTGIPGGIAIPHCRSAAVTEPTLAMARPNPAVSFGAKDGPADLIFFIAAPDGADQAHLKLLSTLARSLMKKSFTASLREASSAEEIVELVNGALGVGEKKAEAKPAEAAPAAPAAEKEAPAASVPVKKIVAVTACPTGIAHTYMAADALKYAAEELGYDLKVETQGSSGNEKLTQADIDAADAVIFAVSVNVRERNRFAGKPFIESPVKRGIDEPKEMIAEALAEAENPNGARVAAAASSGEDSAGATEGAWGSRIYKAVMTGISYMIPFVAAGGILVALGFVFEAITVPNLGDVNTKAILDSATLFNLGDVHWTLYLGAVLQTIGGFGLSLMVPALAAYIAYGLAQRPGIAPGFIAGSVALAVNAGFLGGIVGGILAGLIAYALGTLKLPRWLGSMMPVVITPLVTSLVAGLAMYLLLGAPLAWVMTTLQDWLTSMSGGSALLLGLILGAMMASDLGGPINKAAYLFATAGLSSGATVNQEIMAAVIISGMVPPLAMALATTLRPKLFNENERENGKAAWLLGASFISEGAIPFASADPARVIPSTIVGGAIAGAISMGAHVASPAPHGGIWIIGLAQNPLMFLAAVVAGTVVSALLYVVLKSLGARSKASA
ncbi:PTS lactose transporter subunit IIC [Rothia sp. HMSC071C12]|jgi:PTS system, fru family, IIC component|uniref:PTS fructose transporter subunit IIABC n=1 Tax=Rothia TaxID=32207 RepID=UPI0008A4FD2F|nr:MULTISPECIES: fructose-specific PTS transporter subunit EIIC [unclassified Rothia (in: high G+C Gram-positive bacteria)]MDU2571082.1 fructose-specific PTS transporter subunit EIIC [Rothia mucilaginosa]OFL51078.1 PTS lactose transporter subunit IIC [Rothia sp. HMSC062H08]OFQ35582.1 PTS lactose transporter subunit IIC [Rothia sp. HMSC071C12]